MKLEDLGTEMLGELMLEVTKNYKPPTTNSELSLVTGLEQTALAAAVNAIQVWMTIRAARALTEASAS
jgi:hypothetical protein